MIHGSPFLGGYPYAHETGVGVWDILLDSSKIIRHFRNKPDLFLVVSLFGFAIFFSLGIT